MKTNPITIAIVLAGTLIAIEVKAADIVVPGTSDLWLAGMPPGSTASNGDVAPDQSPLLVTGIQINPGYFYSFSAFGTVRHGPAQTPYGPDGNPAQLTAHHTGAENGIGDLIAPVEALIGVFLGPDQPNLSIAPARLDFTTAASRNYLSLTPALQQPFFIGNGMNADGIRQQVTAPDGASRLFLGTMDGEGWFNNGGQFSVTVVPEPSVILFLSLGSVACLVAVRKKA